MIDVPRRWTMACFIPTMFLFGEWIKTLYTSLGAFPFAATLFIAEVIIALIYGVTILVLYNKVILKLVRRKKINVKYKVGDIVKCENMTTPLQILHIKTRLNNFDVLYILEKGIVMPEDLIIEVVNE
jgi:hypothetical protein